MAYASASDVAALTKNLAGGESTFTESSSPTLAQVETWLSTGCALINAKLLNQGYGALTTAQGAAYELAKTVNALYAGWLAERSRTNARSNPGENTRADMLKEDFEWHLEQLMGFDFGQFGMSKSSRRARAYAGGISVADKDTVRDNTDRVAGKFSRGMTGDPERIDPSG